VQLLYFAYGSNMAEQVMDRLCPGHRFLGAAELAGHRLAFTRRSIRTGSGVADIVRAEGQSVWGALYELDDTQLAPIDEKEGNGWAYERRQVRVRLAGDERELQAHAYAVIAPQDAEIRPSVKYLQGLLDAARERALPAAYVAELAAHCAPAAR
jgi:gamma-glutamylcyclotransferase